MLLEILESTEACFCLLLSDAAKYMIATGITLKSLYSMLLHMTCVAHLLHSCAMKIKSHFEDVDQLIAKFKAVTIKIKPDRQTSLLLVTHLSMFLQDGEAGKMLSCITQKICLK